MPNAESNELERLINEVKKLQEQAKKSSSVAERQKIFEELKKELEAAEEYYKKNKTIDSLTDLLKLVVNVLLRFSDNPIFFDTLRYCSANFSPFLNHSSVLLTNFAVSFDISLKVPDIDLFKATVDAKFLLIFCTSFNRFSKLAFPEST